MRVIWSNFAIERLKEIYIYYREVAGRRIALKINNRIFKSSKRLINHPKSGQLEDSLKKLDEGYRYLVVGNYKLIYKEVKEGVLITDVFDTRQNPVKMNKPNKNK